MTQLMSTLNAAYEVREERSWIKIHLISLTLTLAMAVLFIAALFLVLAGGQVIASAGQAVGFNGAAWIVVKILQWAVALAFVVFAFASIYYFAPNVHEQHWYWLMPGSVVGVGMWAIASVAMRVYLHFYTYSKTYGSLGAVIVLMLWFYLTGLSFLIGSQINATIEHAAAGHGHIEAKGPGKKRPRSARLLGEADHQGTQGSRKEVEIAAQVWSGTLVRPAFDCRCAEDDPAAAVSSSGQTHVRREPRRNG